MEFLSELRNPTTLVGKIITVVLAVLFFLLVSVTAISGFVLYRVVSPGAGARLQPGNLLGNPSVVSFSVPGAGSREALFFPGLKTAPTIILCHGYQSYRGDILTLITALQDHRFNVFVFDFAGHGLSRGLSSLGPREAQEVLAAIAALTQRDDVDRTRFGVWGHNLGGYAVLSAAASDGRVRALVVDSVYDQPLDMLRLQVDRSGLTQVAPVHTLCRWGYKLLNFSSRNEPPLSTRLGSLAGVPKLFIQARENPVLAESTLQLFLKAPEPRIQVVIPKSNFAGMMDDEKRAYENQVVNFFLQHLPPAPVPRPGPARRAR